MREQEICEIDSVIEIEWEGEKNYCTVILSGEGAQLKSAQAQSQQRQTHTQRRLNGCPEMQNGAAQLIDWQIVCSVHFWTQSLELVKKKAKLLMVAVVVVLVTQCQTKVVTETTAQSS